MKTVAQLKEEYPNGIPYDLQLNTIEWKSKREEILERDERKCRHCGAKEYVRNEKLKLLAIPLPEGATILHVHHTYYIQNALAWQYSNNCLLTLCSECHFEIHQNEKIKQFKNEKLDEVIEYTNCYKCSGSGYIRGYKHIQNGVCFKCYGRGFIM